MRHGGVMGARPGKADRATFSLAEALPLRAAQRDKSKKRGRKPAKSASRKAAPTKAAQNGATPGHAPTGIKKKTATAKKPAAAKKTAATKTSASRSTAKTPRARLGPAPR